jgi:predicted nucleotidyltransferase
MLSAPQIDFIKEATRPYRPSFVGVFGSYARNEQTPKSDLDLLVEFDVPVNLLDLIGLEQALTELLGVKVDLVTRRSLNERMRRSIEADMIRLV